MTQQAALIAIAFAGTASAQQMNFVLDDRILVGFGSVETVDGFFDFGSQQSEPDFPFDNWGGFASDGVGSADGSASLQSELSAFAINATGSANASATFDSQFHSFVSALGSSTHGIGFSIDQETTFSLAATLDATGTAQAWARLRNGLFGNDLVFNATTTGGQLLVDETFTLGPGEYEIEFFANSNISLSSDGSASGQSSYVGSFAVIPAVPSAMVPVLAGVLMTRRRR